MTRPAPTGPASVEDLRARIDSIDDAILDLLAQRADAVRDVAQAKAPGVALRPAREAQMIRRLTGSADKHVPDGLVGAVWREIVSGFTHAQTPFAVAVCCDAQAAGDDAGPMALARDHFGRFAALLRVDAPQRAIGLVSSGEAAAALVPPPWSGAERPWWPDLIGAAGSGDAMRINGLLPFAPRAVGRPFPDMVVVGRAPIAPTGDDRSLFAVQLSEPISRDRLTAMLDAAGLSPRAIDQWRPGGGVRDAGGLAVLLIETDGYLDENDRRLADLASSGRDVVDWARRAGAYPTPAQ
ncbi:MAG: chorismate mutase [Pseudomonadota bacterium]